MPRVEARTVAEHRRLILDRVYRAFEALIYERGYDAITLAEIANSSGMARTAIYNYFPDKEALLLAYTAHEMDEFFSDLRAELFDTDDPLDRLDLYVRSQISYFATHHLPPGPTLRSVLSAEGYRAMQAHAVTLEDTLSAILAEAAADGQIPEAVAVDNQIVRLVLACLSSGQFRDRSDAQLETAIGSTQDFVRRAVGAEPRVPLPLQAS